MSIDYELAVESTWKPWSPRPGQRVRIRLSEECSALRAKPGEKENLTRYHSRSETGRIGTVIEESPGVWNPRQGLAGHDILIDFSPDSIHFQGCISFCGLYFAAEELEPAADDADTTRETIDGETAAYGHAQDEAPLGDTPSGVPPRVRKPNQSRRERREDRRRARPRGSLSDHQSD